MKKLLLIFLVFSMCISICACGNESQNQTQSQSQPQSEVEDKTVSLTTDNINEFIELNTSYGEFDTHYFGDIPISSDIELIFEAFALQGGSFKNAEIIVKVTLPTSWKYNDEENETTIAMKIPADGKIEQTYKLTSPYNRFKPGDCEIQIISVSGEFVED